MLGQEQLTHTLFPLGNLTKVKVRELARTFKLPVAEKLDSQEICFLPDNNYRVFLGDRFGSSIKPGLVVDTGGKVVGRHKGIAFYTIGQRGGLGIALGYPAFVIKIDPRKNQVVLGKREQASASQCIIRNPHFIAKPIKKNVALKVRIRYNHKESLADIKPGASVLHISFRKPQFAITPGQSAVVYDKDIVLGGGIIDKVVI
jgi:tRNA-specific 2-thiouridylase